MDKLTKVSGRIKVSLYSIAVGGDLCVIISGGTSPHIGCVTLSIPRPSLADANLNSATTSVLNLTGHKDDEVLRYISQTLAAKLARNVVVTGGIHVADITPEEITATGEMVKELTAQLLERYL